MGWFDEQVRQRIQEDEEILEEAYLNLSSVVLGRGVITAALNNDRKKTENAYEELLRYFHIKAAMPPVGLEEMEARLEYLLHPAGVMYREVKLEGEWYLDGMGPLIGSTVSGDTVALIPGHFGRYTYFDYNQGKRVKVSRHNQMNIQPEAICFYRPLPLRPLKSQDLFRYMFTCLDRGDAVLVILSTLAVTLLGFLSPYATQVIFQQIVPSGRLWLVGSIGALLLGGAVSLLLMSIIRGLLVERVRAKVSVATEAALMARLIALPATFFRKYSAGELANRSTGVGQLCTLTINLLFSVGLTAVFSLLYIVQAAVYVPALVLPMVGLTTLNLLWIALTTRAQFIVNTRKMEADARLEGIVHALYAGIQKIRLSGAERRAFGIWAGAYQESARHIYAPPLLVKLAPVGQLILSMGGIVALYACALHSGAQTPDYLAFSTAYGQLSTTLLTLGPAALAAGATAPILKLLEGILSTSPEETGQKKMVTNISGSIELSNVSFRYQEDMPQIINNLSLKIRPGQYVAIVGSTGCGKSTLLRLLLGFETPQKGAIYYDGKDLQTLDAKSVRRQIGVVLQNSNLLSGSIFSNIAVASTQLTMDDAWTVAEAAGIADDIRAMPMGMHTVISEGGSSISGGQKQRLMIARAIASKPKILMFDEATSALDNRTQKLVSEALDGLKSTRIVIAHRLSTIRQCDRILVLDKGSVIEDGTYEELLQKNGFFAELVSRQQLFSGSYVEKTTIY